MTTNELEAFKVFLELKISIDREKSDAVETSDFFRIFLTVEISLMVTNEVGTLVSKCRLNFALEKRMV